MHEAKFAANVVAVLPGLLPGLNGLVAAVFVSCEYGRQCCCAGVPVLVTTPVRSTIETKGSPGSPLITARRKCGLPSCGKVTTPPVVASSSPRRSPHVGSEKALPFAEAIQGATPRGPS